MQLLDLIFGSLSHGSSPLRVSVKGHRTEFLRIGEDLLRKARKRKQPLSIVVFGLSDLPELECLFGHRVAKDVVASFAVRLGKVAASGLATRSAPTVFMLMLPNVDREEALDLIYETFGKPCRIEVNADKEEIVLVPEIMVRDLATETMPLEQAFKSLCHEVAGLAATKPPASKTHREACYSPLPPTIPVPIGLR